MNQICSVCKSSSSVLMDSALSVYECFSCTHQFTVISKEHQEPYSQEYFLKTHKNWFLHPDIKLFDLVIEKIKNPSLKVLDVGCGQGAFLKRFREKDKTAQLYGIDLIHNSFSGITFIQDDFDTYKFTEKFDVITGFMVVEHMNNPDFFVKKIHSLLKPNGIMVLNTINSSGLLYTLTHFFKNCGWRAPLERLYDHHHLQHYSFQSFENLISNRGFTLVEHLSHNFPLAAIDVPQDNKTMAILYKLGVSFTFKLIFLMGQGMNQTIFCKK